MTDGNREVIHSGSFCVQANDLLQRAETGFTNAILNFPQLHCQTEPGGWAQLSLVGRVPQAASCQPVELAV